MIENHCGTGSKTGFRGTYGRIHDLDVRFTPVAFCILRLQREAYSLEANLIHFSDLPPLLETVHDLHSSGETFIGYYENETLKGVASFKVGTDTVLVCRLAVAPLSLRRGIASALVKRIEHIMIASGKHALEVCTASSNYPALSLYRTLGFHFVRREITPDGLIIERWRKDQHNSSEAF
jgi:ribosomal protein S18 acetylase RimI-like enzyme